MTDARSAPLSRRSFPYLSFQPRHIWSRTDAGLAALLFLISLFLYTKTLAPTISSVSFDSAELITKSAQIRMPHMPGSPFYVWIAHLFTRLPFGELATRVDWLSALFAAVTVGLLYLLIVRYVTGERLNALGGTMMLALSVTFWSQAVIAELYTGNMAFVTFTLLALLEWAAARYEEPQSRRRSRLWLILAAAGLGLSFGIHASDVLLIPGIAIFMLLGWPVERRGKFSLRRDLWLARPERFDLIGGLMATAVGIITVVVPYTWLYFVLPFVPAGDGFPKADPGWPMFYAATFNAFSDWRFAFPLAQEPDRVVVFLRLLWFNLGPVGLALMFLGAFRLLKTRLRLFYLLMPIALANIVFYINYKAPDIDVFFIPSYWVMASFMASGLQAVALGVRAFVQLRIPTRQHGIATSQNAQQSHASLGIVAFSPWFRRPPEWLPIAALAVVLIPAWGWGWQTSYEHCDRSQDLSFRDFYGNLFTQLPEGAYYYHRGAAMGYDLLYYTEAYHVRPDLRIQAGPLNDEPRHPVWPQAPVFSGTNKYDIFLPAFLADNKKWYDQWMFGMFDWKSNILWGWLKSYKVRRDLPMEWMVSAGSPQAQPSHVLNMPFTSLLTLVGFDAEPTAQRGRPWHLVRYWRTTLDHIPPMATILGDHQAIEIHSPLSDQFTDYIHARKIEDTDLGNYIVRDDVYLVIPSNIPTGRYNISNSTINRSIGSLMYEPAKPSELVPREKFLTTLEVTDALPLNPLDLPRGQAGK